MYDSNHARSKPRVRLNKASRTLYCRKKINTAALQGVDGPGRAVAKDAVSGTLHALLLPLVKSLPKPKRETLKQNAFEETRLAAV